MEDKLLTGALIFLALLMLALMYRVVKGPRYTDRLVAVNAINTMITASICLLSRLHRAPYLLDVALIYALLGFAALFLALGLFLFFSEVVGFYRFRYVMNRMHAAAIGDTLGIASIVIATAILTGGLVETCKLILIIVFMFLTGPVLTHLIAGEEVATHRPTEDEYREEDRR